VFKDGESRRGKGEMHECLSNHGRKRGEKNYGWAHFNALKSRRMRRLVRQIGRVSLYF